jgi:site-specific DNA-methyltransferase (adenine-specific)
VVSVEINKIYCGDSASLLKEIPNNFIDLTVTSPPYDNLRDYEGYTFDFYSIANQLFRVTKDGGIVVWIVCDQTKDFSETLTSFEQAIYFVKQVGFKLLDTMIYQKKGSPSPYPNMRRYAPIFEYMFVFSKGKPKTFNPIKDRENKSFGKINSGNTARQRDGKTIQTGSYLQEQFSIRTNVWVYDVGKNKDTRDDVLEHPARFPELLAKDHILTWTNEGDMVLDCFVGSGTTTKIAKQLFRNFIGIDISEKYCKMAEKRLLQNTLEVKSGCDANDDGIPPNNKLLGILPNEL